MDKQRFSCSPKLLVFYYTLTAASILVVFFPFVIDLINRSLLIAVNRYKDFHKNYLPILAFGFVGVGSLIRLAVQFSSLYPIEIDDFEITQYPWFGRARIIPWKESDRIQVFAGFRRDNQFFFRMRIFSKSTVIVFSKELRRSEVLIKLVSDQARHRQIPIYREKRANTVFRRGSWEIDSFGNSAGNPVSLVQDIPSFQTKSA